ncbi:hypothetical protein HMPREF1556_00970 [Porphyromonas sp. oral taxon 278 str. W7784]|nr:hypothetical protein HMPREF1556_00970 [Porphyromonas sp. oral taxon 278 str. W7784]
MRPRTSLFKPREALLLPLSKRYCRLRRGTTATSMVLASPPPSQPTKAD